ncbi:GNAT family N-acetyltransferase [Actinopolymorpha rutila]|uniref:GNAT superfamily N-acetyltransferase n=1 Tax=Actinopolymorpha rutila TaxID=446787 RepID=A0A852ZJD2_9ACTN|nr:GNAT family protein [Actinopolymorpha rutila]NYH89669.1 GNAT superfamily N-acetyltransferase [Actinopolymorpha rutila]
MDDEATCSPLNPFAVREADRGDATAIGEIHAAAWMAGFAHLLDHDYLTAAADRRRGMWTELIGDRRMRRSTVLVAVPEADGQPVAFAHIGPAGVWNDGKELSTDLGEIYGFYAHPSVWGSGVSTMLMSHAWISLAGQAFAKVCLWTLEGACRARRFYGKSGFRETGNARDHDFGGGRQLREVEYGSSLVAVDKERHGAG